MSKDEDKDLKLQTFIYSGWVYVVDIECDGPTCFRCRLSDLLKEAEKMDTPTQLMERGGRNEALAHSTSEEAQKISQSSLLPPVATVP